MPAEATLEFVIPFYGDPAYLKETVRSLLAQTDRDWTATVLDDCYPDPSVGEWVRDLGEHRLSVVRNDENLGVTRSFSKALRIATADYLVILGADDRLLPHYVERMRQVIGTTGATVVQPGVQVIDGEGQTWRPRVDRVKNRLRPSAPASVLAGQDITASLLRGNWTYFPSLCWERSTVAALGFRQYDVVLDLALLVDVLVAGGTLALDPAVTFEYRRHATSVSSVQALSGARFDEERAYFRAIAAELADHGWLRAARAAASRPTSRAHAASLVPIALRARDISALGRLVRHAVST